MSIKIGEADLKFYLKLAYASAQHSNDLSTQNGAVLVDFAKGADCLVVACGHNDLHYTFNESAERRARPLKYQWTEHAERAAIFDAARQGIKTVGLVMFCPWFACADCGRAIVYAGIRAVIGHDIPQHKEAPHWQESIAVAEQMFKEAGVDVLRYQGKLGVSFRFGGNIIEV